MTFKNKVKAVILFLFTGFVLLKLYFWVPIFYDMMPDLLTKAIFILSLLLIVVSALVVMPVKLFLADNNISVKGLLQAILAFMGGTFAIMIMGGTGNDDGLLSVVLSTIASIAVEDTTWIQQLGTVAWVMLLGIGMLAYPGYKIYGEKSS